MLMSKMRMSLLVSVALCGGAIGCGSTPKHAEMVANGSNLPASPLAK